MKPMELTVEQIKRIEGIYEITGELEYISREETVDEWRDSLGYIDFDIERQLEYWEMIAEAYSDERRLRPKAKKWEREVVYDLLVEASSCNSWAEVLKRVPEALELPDLRGVLERLTKWLGWEERRKSDSVRSACGRR